MIIEFDDCQYMKIVKELIGERCMIRPLSCFMGLPRSAIKRYIERLHYNPIENVTVRYDYDLMYKTIDLYKAGVSLPRIARILNIPIHRTVNIIKYFKGEENDTADSFCQE